MSSFYSLKVNKKIDGLEHLRKKLADRVKVSPQEFENILEGKKKRYL